MRRILGLVVVCLFAATLFANRFSARTDALHIIESACKFSLQGDAPSVQLAVENSGSSLPATIKIELLDTHDELRATGESEIVLAAGNNQPTISLRRTRKAEEKMSDLLWYRVKYRMEIQGGEALEGIISVSRIWRDVYELSVTALDYLSGEPSYPVYARTMHPLTGAPVAGVKVEAALSYDDGAERIIRARGMTDAMGMARLEFPLPPAFGPDRVELQIQAERNGARQELEDDIEFLYLNQILTATDKPLYQPGQTIHTRVVAFTPEWKAMAAARGTWKLLNSENEVIHRAEFQTSRFGVANIDWPIPEGTRMGQYWVQIWLGEESSQRVFGQTHFKISRYDLPNFTVEAKADRGYYLSGQNAEIAVSANYLFGQPVKAARVRVVRELERRWDYKEQKWVTEEGETIEGAFDEQGKFLARVDLAKEHEQFTPYRYGRSEDIQYGVSVTDLSTGRTERRQVELRITRDPIHVYLIERDPWPAAIPTSFYVSAFYADGTPAECDVNVYRDSGDEEKSPSEPALQTVRTNRYGVAKVASLGVTEEERNEGPRLRLIARDREGRTGQTSRSLRSVRSETASIGTDKILYRAGEPIRVRLQSEPSNHLFVVDVMANTQLLISQVVKLKDGQAEVSFPFQKEFRGPVTIVAYPPFGSSYEISRATSHWGVFFPHDRELRMDLNLNQASYQPGEEARAAVQVRTAAGRPVEAALGALAYDQAVEARVRADQDFRNPVFGFSGITGSLYGSRSQLGDLSFRDLNKLNLSQPVSADLALATEVLLCGYTDSTYRHSRSGKDSFETSAQSVYGPVINARMKYLREALDFHYARKSIYPVNEDSLRRLLQAAGHDRDELLVDPWGIPFRSLFSTELGHDKLKLVSAGPDKRFDSPDDFTVFRGEWNYSAHLAKAIERAVESFYLETGNYLRDRESFRRALQKRESLDLDALRDRWGQAYAVDFRVSQRRFVITLRSSGPNQRFEEGKHSLKSDDFAVASASIDYTTDLNLALNQTLKMHFLKTREVPQTEEELQAAGFALDAWRDGWGNRYYATFRLDSLHADRVVIYDQARHGEKPTQKTEVIPVTRKQQTVLLRSAGEDGKVDTPDDFDVSRFTRIIGEESAKSAIQKAAPSASPPTHSYAGPGGMISGAVTDPQGAIVPGATVELSATDSPFTRSTKTNRDGQYEFKNLKPGLYNLRITAAGFKVSIVADVNVIASLAVHVDVMVNPGTVSETVTVTSETPTMMTEQSASVTTEGRAPMARTIMQMPISTPRLREYFPETLLWLPLLETDKQGRSQLKFKLADNITTWKVSVLGTTVDGQIGFVEKEIRAFQPFFAEHEPPKVLTEGDEISLPVVIRNYLEKPQSVTAELKPEAWFETIGSRRQRTDVKAGDAGRVTFDFRAKASVRDGKQRVTAIAGDASDAIEKPVSVHPDGEEIAASTGGVFTDQGAWTMTLPANTIPRSTKAELKVYPNLMAHALEGVEGILQRPYGCAEQTISSTYPNVMLLRYFEKQPEPLPESQRREKERALRFAREGYQRLLGYRNADGGFGYWSGNNADPSLTAYALRFFSDAADVIDIDEDVQAKARTFLLSRQQLDGRWIAPFWTSQEHENRTAITTAYVLRVLALEKNAQEEALPLALKLAFDYLAKRMNAIDEPYLTASYALAAIGLEKKDLAGPALAKLAAGARDEAGARVWSLQQNTPFYGWGLAGQIETTSLAVLALHQGKTMIPTADRKSIEDLVDRGLLFLMRNKDRYGVWHSTQTTINVLQALLALHESESTISDAAGRAEVFINGKSAGTVALPPARQLSNPVSLDLSAFVQAGENRIEIRREGTPSRASAQMITTYYAPWSSEKQNAREQVTAKDASALRLSVQYDRAQAAIGESILCRVKAERVGYRGDYGGMMLAEIGLPPGAEVDRDSLDRARKESHGAFNHYDILPDRVVMYLWPHAGGTNLAFSFKTRFGIRAASAPSLLYDYYNPEARTVVAPVRFSIR